MVGVGVAVALLGLLVVGAAVSVVQDSRARRRRDEPGRAAAFRRILFTELPAAGAPEDPPGAHRAERWSSFGDGQVRIVPPEELAAPEVIELPPGSPVPQQPQSPPARVPRQRLGRPEAAAEPCRSSLPPV